MGEFGWPSGTEFLVVGVNFISSAYYAESDSSSKNNDATQSDRSMRQKTRTLTLRLDGIYWDRGDSMGRRRPLRTGTGGLEYLFAGP